MGTTRRNFMKTVAAGSAGLTIGGIGFGKSSYKHILRSNDRIRVGVVGFSDTQVTALTGSNLGSDPMTFAHMKNWMECVRNRKEANGNIRAAYNHSIANIMTNAALHTGEKAVFNEQTQDVMAGGKVFKY